MGPGAIETVTVTALPSSAGSGVTDMPMASPQSAASVGAAVGRRVGAAVGGRVGRAVAGGVGAIELGRDDSSVPGGSGKALDSPVWSIPMVVGGENAASGLPSPWLTEAQPARSRAVIAMATPRRRRATFTWAG